MLPRAIQDIIEAYALDMCLLESMPKRVSRRYMKHADRHFNAAVLCNAIFSRGTNMSEVHRLAEYHFERTFFGTAAGWVFMHLIDLEERRTRIWEDLNIPVSSDAFDRASIQRMSEKSTLLTIRNNHASEAVKLFLGRRID